MPPAGRHPHVRRVLLASTAVISAFVMLVGVVGMAAYFWTSSKIRTFDITTLVVEPSPGASPTAPGPADISGKCDTQSCNYLLLGSDSPLKN